MPTIIDWPDSQLPATLEIEPSNISRSGGRTLTGREDIVATDAGFWVGKMSFQTRSDAYIVLWRGIRTMLEGRTNILRLPTFDGLMLPAVALYGPSILGTVPHSDDAPFSDLSEYASGAIDASLTAAIAVRATSLTMAISDIWPILPGNHFSLEGRLHIVKSYQNFGAFSTITFWPPTRSAYAAGTRVEFDRPTGFWRLAEDTTGKIPRVANQISTVNLDLVEAVEYFPPPPAPSPYIPPAVGAGDGGLDFDPEGNPLIGIL